MRHYPKQTCEIISPGKTLLFFLGLASFLFLITGCEKNHPDPNLPLAQEFAAPPEERPDGEWEKSTLTDPGVYTNEAPCGKYTVAMVHDINGNGSFTFGAFGDGQLGVLSALPPEYADENFANNIFSSPLELLTYLVGDVPEEVALSLIEGEPGGTATPFVKEVDFSTLMVVNPAYQEKANAYCSNGTAWLDDFAYPGGWVDNFIKNNFSCGTSAFYSGLNCIAIDDIEMFYNSGSTWGGSLRTASNYEDTQYGCCAAYGRVVSCDNYTKFNAYRREEWQGGAWTEVLDYWIAPNYSAIWKMYSNGDHSCRDLKDRDDFRFKAESVPGASHRYGYAFIEKHITHSSPGLCFACP